MQAPHLALSVDLWHRDAMGEIVNLRRARKAKARDEAAEQATANRARTGLTKAAREAEAKRRIALGRQLDGARLDDEERR